MSNHQTVYRIVYVTLSYVSLLTDPGVHLSSPSSYLMSSSLSEDHQGPIRQTTTSCGSFDKNFLYTSTDIDLSLYQIVECKKSIFMINCAKSIGLSFLI